MPAALGLLALAYFIRRYEVSLIWLLLGGLIWCLLMGQLVNGNFAYLAVPMQAVYLGLALVFLGGLLVLIRSRSALAWTLLGMLVIVHLPILHLKGPHYLYWPAAFWGMLDAYLLWCAGRQWQDSAGQPRHPRQASGNSTDPSRETA